MPGCTSMPSVEVAASPECATLISATSRHYLYGCIDLKCSVTRIRQIRRTKNSAAPFEFGGAFRVVSHVKPTHFGCVAVTQTLDVKISELVKQ
jgi:hypothetical protein